MKRPDTSRNRSARSVSVPGAALRILLAVLVLLALTSTVGVAVAQQEGEACPDQNGNAGFENAGKKGNPQAHKAFLQEPANVCERLGCEGQGGICG